MKRSTKIGIAAVPLIIAVMLVGAAIIPHVGEITTTAIVDKQAVEISADGNNWNSYDDPVTHTISDVTPGGTYCFKQWVRSSAAIPVDVTFERMDSWGAEAITKIYALSPTTTLILEDKDPDTWEIIPDGAQATLTFDTVAKTFNYDLTATGLAATTDYAIIYYADHEDRDVVWGGDNGGVIIDTFSTDTSGNEAKTNSVNLAMNLPASTDANIDIHDYSGTPDFYPHAHGAKIWIVPTSDLTGGALPLANWNPTAFLFETDLIIYLDCNKPVDDYFCGLLGDELTGPMTMQPEQVIPTIICHTFDLHVGIGTYYLSTIVDVEETPSTP